MYRTNARVKGGRLYQSQTESHPIVVGSPTWFDWLEQHRAFLFVDRVGRFTAHKRGTDPDDQNWEANRTHKGKRSHVLLGPSHLLTLERLQAAAQMLAVTSVSLDSLEEDLEAAAASTQSMHKTAAAVGLPSILIHTKLYRPRSSSHVIPRVRLMERLNAGLSENASLVCAPAGFGKTTLVAQWVETTGRPTAWLSLDEDDNELAIFVNSITSALQTIFPDAFEASASLLTAPQFPPPSHVATLLINDLANVPEALVLVLDEYHSIHNQDVHSILEMLITHLPQQVHVVLISRFDPPLPLATWLAKGYLQRVRPVDLRFTLKETEAFLTGILGGALANATADVLQQCTEGWIAVVRLAALSLRGTSDVEAFLDQVRHNTERSISRYLLEEVFEQQTPSVQTVLEQMSILERCCVDLCVTISGNTFTHEQMQTIMDWVARTNLFLVPLDDRQGWYRFHRLFQGLLQQRLREHSSSEEMATLHRRASTWYAIQGLLDEALRHALLAGDASRAAQLVEAHFHRALEQEDWMHMERWLRVLPEDQIQSSPCLLLARAWVLQSHGQITSLPPLLTAVERALASTGCHVPAQADSWHRLLHTASAISWCQFQYFTGSAQLSLESAQRACSWCPAGEEYLASLASMYLALSQQANGQEVVALVTLHEALLDHATQRNSTVRLLFAQALVFLAVGKLHQVEHIARYVVQLAQKAELAMSHSWAHWLLGLVHYEWNNLDAAVSHLSVVVDNKYLAHSWTVQESLYLLACAYRAQGQSAEAQKAARNLLEFVQEQHSQRDLLVAYAFYGQLLLMQDGVEAAEPWLRVAGEQEELVGPMTSFEVLAVTRAWMLLAKGDDASVARAQGILTRLSQYVEAIHSTRKTIQVLALQAWASALQGCESEALTALERALILARPGEFIRTFADIPVLFGLLQKLLTCRRFQQAVDHTNPYLKRVLIATNPLAAHAVIREELLRQEGLEP